MFISLCSRHTIASHEVLFSEVNIIFNVYIWFFIRIIRYEKTILYYNGDAMSNKLV
ncbi:hypothetical protein YN1HA_7410 [Sulfurisphaera ohwakuensis]